ncbi:hypothetical protein COLO4_34408 [Corchorus olitorius]|uniref:TF-B3 domain-containing protein n=1 Tax=Corchorus olitorius TaxID=93759 RepID=A0A1R3GL03_9ROSI|nr:hypothetical protein COLO4_34408 [Corchorus olitorius]
MDSQKPHFCKILLGLGIHLSILRFPRNFIRKHGEIASPVQLKVADGCTFRVEVKRKGGELCMVNWRQFAEQYSLKHGHFLLFEYQGGSIFRVFIFDPSATEIEYGNYNQEAEAEEEENSGERLNQKPTFVQDRIRRSMQHIETEHGKPNKENDQEENSADRLNETNQEAGDSQSVEMGVEGLNHINQEEEADHEDYDSVEILNQTPRDSKSENKCLRRSKRRKTASDKNKYVSEDVSDNDSVEILNQTPRESKMGNKRPEDQERGVNASAEMLRTEKKCCLLQKRRKTTSDKNKTDSEDVSSDEGDKGNSNSTDNPSFVVEMQPSYIDPGYKLILPIDFIKYLPNKTGNVTLCTMDGRNILKCNGSCCSMLPLTSHEKATALLRAKDFGSDYPYFKVVMQPAYLGRGRWRLYIPNKFVKENMDKEKNKVILQVSDGKTWDVDFSVLAVPSGQQKPQISGKNWRKFADHNKLHVGDVCVFELIDHTNEGDSIFKVSIFYSSKVK